MKLIILSLIFATTASVGISQTSVSNENVKTDSTLRRKTDTKFIEITKVSLFFENPEVDYQEFKIIHQDDLKSAMVEEEEKWLKKELKAQEKETFVSSSTEKQQISIDYTIFTGITSDTLIHFGYSDTVKSIYPDNLNTLFIEGKILKIHEFLIKTPTGNRKDYFKLKIIMKWYIKNIYGETLDSITTTELSDKFDSYFDYPHFTMPNLINTVESGVVNSLFGLMESSQFQAHTAIVTSSDKPGNIFKIEKPLQLVQKKEDAVHACVTIKTKNGHGSGFAISNDGYILTNFHVVAGEEFEKYPEITVINNKGEEMIAQVIRVNRSNDLALLKVDKSFEKAFKITSTKQYEILQTVYTIGTPKSTELGQSIAMGVISNERKAKNLDLIQLGMPINSGNSGGPLFSMDGALQGVIVAKLFGWGTEGISFAIPGYRLTEYLNIEY